MTWLHCRVSSEGNLIDLISLNLFVMEIENSEHLLIEIELEK